MGFSKELFLNHVDDEFTCSICLNVLEDPVQVCAYKYKLP